MAVMRPTYLEPVVITVVAVAVFWITGGFETAYVVLMIPLGLAMLKLTWAIFHERKRQSEQNEETT